MAFCTVCGAAVEGRFCQKCGAAAGAAAPPAAAPVARRTSPLVWILVAFGALVVLVCGLFVVGGLFVFHKARQAGLDPELWAKNPGVAVAKMLATANPDAEVVSVNEAAGVVVIRDKRDGKIVELNFADLKQGRMTVEGDGEKVTLGATSQGDSSTFEITGKNGAARLAMGSTVKLPSWLPAYPGATDVGGITGSGPDGEGGTYGFKTKDAPGAVIKFYDDALKNGGYTVKAKGDAAEATFLNAEKDKTQVTIGAAAQNGVTSVSITYGKQ